MDVKEKLMEILGEFLLWPSKMKNVWMPQGIEKLADHLISHGVTVQEWISVNDRLPDDEQEVLVIAHGWDGRLVYVGRHKRVEAQKSWLTGITNKPSEWSLWGWSYLKEPMVTHWMPLPEPPEEG